MFADKCIEDLRKGTWAIDCIEMTLTQNDVPEPTTFTGPGYLRQDESGEVIFKLYPTQVSKYDHWKDCGRAGTPGKLVESSRYYRLHARDRRNRAWTVPRIRAEVSGSFLPDRVSYVVDGTVAELALSQESAYVADYHGLKIYFFADARVPCNAVTQTVTTVAGTKHEETSILNVASFPTRFGDFRIAHQAGMVVVKVESDTPFPPHFEVRVVEALGLALGKPLYWNAVEMHSGGTETMRVRGRRVAVEGKLLPPAGGGEIDLTGQVWVLFEHYLAFVCARSDPGLHPCSRHLFSVLEASAGAISAKALALGVAVEGIVKEVFPNAGSLPEGLKPAVRALCKHCEKWEGFRDEAIKAALWKRIQDQLGRILEVGTRAKLNALAKDKVVCDSHVKAWAELRNKSAHGVTPGSRDLQELVDLCNTVTVLLYHLIFRAIGFEGAYIDYATHGWPLRRYRGRPVTEEEIAVSAHFIWEKKGKPHGDDLADWFAARTELESGVS